MTPEEFLKRNDIIIVDGEYTDETVVQAFQEGQSSPKIKQLEWDFYGLYYEVKTAVGHYMILQGDEQYFENHNTCTLTFSGGLMADFDNVDEGGLMVDFDSVDEAKAAAQADFEKCIKEYLE